MKRKTTSQSVFLILTLLFLKIDFLKAQNTIEVFPIFGGYFHCENFLSNSNTYEKFFTYNYYSYNCNY
jgi:hypothetical protein